MTVNDKKISWKDVRAKLTLCSERDLLTLISDLYSLDAKNKRFLEARFISKKDSLTSYKKTIRESVHPDIEKPFQLREGRNAIAEYKKATGNIEGTLDLMIYYVECGTEFTLEYGDIDGPFYNSLGSMFEAAAQLLKKADARTIRIFLPRLLELVSATKSMGWGYHDYLTDALYEAFPNADEQ